MRKPSKAVAIGANGLSRRQLVGAAAGAAAVAAGAAFLPKKVFAQKKVTVKYTLGWLPEGANIWSYAAKQFWAKSGIDVVIEKGTGSAAATQAIAQGKYEFGIPAAPNSIQQAVKGLPLLSLGCFNYDTTMGVAVRPEGPIKAPADLKGKKVGSTLTSGEYPFLPAFLKNVGLTMKDIQSVALDNKVREVALIDKQCDAITCFIASALPKLMAAGVNPRVFLYSKYGLPFYAHSLTTTPEFFAKEKALCEAMTMGLSEGVKFALLNPSETIEILFKEVPELKLASTAKEQLEIGMGVWAANYCSKTPMEKGVGFAEPAVYAKMTELILENASAPGDKKPDPNALFTNEFVGKLKLTDAEWAKAKAASSKYALG
ncbi:ABC transporter substrate-binding protein [Reyranella sp.]|uniref:ABC transporter substrate-binding protein n=1 Tax=Reyranella sp. TaxID=1929291 RepID=UPI003BA84E90